MLSSVNLLVHGRSHLINAGSVLALGGAIALCIPTAVIADASIDATSIAHQVVVETRFKHSRQSLSRAKLIYNNHAYRLIPLAENEGFELFVNTNSNAISMIDRKREIIHQIDLTEEDTLDPQLLTTPQTQRFVSLPGQLDPQPCMVNGGKKTGLLNVDNVELETWTCQGAPLDTPSAGHDQVTEQHYSPRHSRVVYSLFASGLEYQMQDIQLAPLDTLFANPTTFRTVSKEEFFGIVQPIGAYVPSASDQQTGPAAEVKN